MSLEQNNWRPSANITQLKQRAEIIKTIRAFFQARHLLEVETPILADHTITDPFIQPLTAYYPYQNKTLYLQTSPEYFMKRLLAAGSGDIFQISKCFRDDAISRIHNPEFTMLEWYRIGFDHHQLMDEMAQLLELILPNKSLIRMTYQAIFLEKLQLDPLSATITELKTAAKIIDCPDLGDDRDGWLQILFTEIIEPSLLGICFVYDFPLSQASLARTSTDDPRVAHRFEVYVDGIELANGFYELTDAQQQLQRFQQDNRIRDKHHLPQRDIDQKFLAALKHGLPDCAGVALGLDRLIMLATNQPYLSDISIINN